MTKSDSPRVVVVDNYDSFTYNLVQCLLALGARCEVCLSDCVNLDALGGTPPSGVLISPGPGRPESAGMSVPLIRALAGSIPILGICLGHQAIAHAFGGRVQPAARPTHGQAADVVHDGRGVFAGLPMPLRATRYHSLVVVDEGLPDALEVTARTHEGEIMGLRHRELALEGVQFHPESILTEHGPQLVQNWLGQL
jgi:anthranilate synthase/aminodeoxychorismate synthase-like glutamine amidotransferase